MKWFTTDQQYGAKCLEAKRSQIVFPKTLRTPSVLSLAGPTTNRRCHLHQKHFGGTEI